MSSTQDKIVVLGAGAWGTALASNWAAHGLNVCLIARNKETAQSLQETRRNEPYLPGLPLAENLEISGDKSRVAQASIVVVVTPAQTITSVLSEITPMLNAGTNIVFCSKGIDRNTGRTMVEIAAEILPHHPHGVLSGPSFAHDVIVGLPTAVTLAHGTGEARALQLATLLSTSRFRIYASTDCAGVEAGGALKNVMALAVGIARGLELGASAEAALISRGFSEMTQLAIAMGGRAETLSGLSGLGDLVLTCSSPQSRNFSYGMALARQESLKNRPLAEGVHTASVAVKLSQKNQLDVPIMTAVDKVLRGDVTPAQAVQDLLNRPLKSET